MITFVDINYDEPTVVAVRVALNVEHDGWQWFLDPDQKSVLLLARESGRVLTWQKRGEDGRFRLYAKLVRWTLDRPRHAKPIALAPAGKGMFEP